MSPEELVFLRMALPLHEVVTGMGKFPVPRDVVILAQWCCTPELSPDVVERLPKIFAVTGTMESRMKILLGQVIHHAHCAFMRAGRTQDAAELRERNITEVYDIDTHLGRLKVDYRMRDVDYTIEIGPHASVITALTALRDISRHEAAPEKFALLLDNLNALMSQRAEDAVKTQRDWIAILDAWISAPLAE